MFVRHRETGVEQKLTDHPGYDSDARWSPDGTRIVFQSDRDGRERYDTRIYIMDADGANLRRLTPRDEKSSYPAWSPDGARIVYVAETDGQRDLWWISLDGSGNERLTTHPGNDTEPSWSPDGWRILFATERYGESSELAILELR